jgi:D-alanyl-D-alanine carboxypeptidase
VTITASEASLDKYNSLMTATNGKSLEAGEVVKLRDLIRGMMYYSGNDAALAVGRYIAQAYNGPAADVNTFVTMLNNHIAGLGLTHTHLTNPPGWDNPAHYTTARELAAELQHGLQDQYFAQVMGFEGTYVATTQGPNGMKTYSRWWGDAYPGSEGTKGGTSTNCVGPNNGCWVTSAKRIGRRLVAAAMQGWPDDMTSMLDYGFATVFHPDQHGTSQAWGAVSRQDVDCFGANRAVTAEAPPVGPVSLGIWNTNVDGYNLTELQEASLPGSGAGIGRGAVAADVDVTRLPWGDFILATRRNGSVELSRWAVPRGGVLTLLASGFNAGTASAVGVQPVYGDMFLVAMTEPGQYGGDLVVQSWRLQGSGLVLLDTYRDSDHFFTDVSITGPLTTDVFNGHRAVTAARGPDGDWIAEDAWGVDPATGKITRLGEHKFPYGESSHVDITPIQVAPAFDGELTPAYYAIGYQTFFGNFEVHFIRIDPAGNPVQASVEQQTPFQVDRVQLAPLGTGGLMAALRDPFGNVKLLAMDAQRNADDTISTAVVSQHDASSASSLSLCRLSSTHAEGDYVTSTRDLDGQLRLRAYRSSDRTY